MIKKIIFSDLDGTLLNKDHKISFFTKAIIKKLRQNDDFLFVVNTGRIPQSAIKISKKLGCHKKSVGYVIANNGAQIYSFSDEKLIYNKILEFDELCTMHKILHNKSNLDVHFYSYNSLSVYKDGKDSRYWSKLMQANYNIIKKEEDFKDCKKTDLDDIVRLLIIFKEKENSKENIQETLDELIASVPSLQINKQTDHVYEVTRKNVNKGNAMKLLAKRLNVKIDDTISFGDSYNDFSLIQKAGVGIVVKNAIPELKKIADKVIEGNQKHGPALYIWRQFIRNEFN